MSGFDVVFGLVVFASVAFGYARGGVREAFALFAFVVAAIAAVLILPAGVWLLGWLVHPRWIAVVAAIVVVFVVAYLTVKMLGVSATARLRVASLEGLDRLAGGGVGLVRALVLLGLVSLLLESAPWPQQRPGWMRTSFSYPVARGAGRVVTRVAPIGGHAASRLFRFLAAQLITGVEGSGAETQAETRDTAAVSIGRRLSNVTGERRDDLVWAGGSR